MAAATKMSREPVYRWLGHHLLLLVALLTYFVDPEDAVWRFIKHSPHVRPLEHLCFGIAAAALGVAAAMHTLNRQKRQPSDRLQKVPNGWRYILAFLHACGIGSLLPLSGFLIFVAGEIVFASRPKWHIDSGEVSGWCAFVSMLVFAITLNDRTAEALFAATALISLLPTKRS